MRRIASRDYKLFGRPLWSSVKADHIQLSFSFGDGGKDPAISRLEKEKDISVISETAQLNYRIGSWLLMDCYTELCRKGVEVMEHVCGFEWGNTLTWERLNRFPLSIQNACFVKGEASASFSSLMTIEEHGYALTGWVHSHLGTGQSSVVPSGTDMKNQKALESAKYHALGAIFSQNGYIRFFSDTLKFRVEIMGKGVEQHDETVYKITGA